MSDQYVGEIRLFAFPRVPVGWLPCNGQSIPISQFDVLFAIIGTTYGGDGVQTFNVPDLRGRVPIGQGQGRTLPPAVLGQMAGEDGHALIDIEMPLHSHALVSSTTTATTPTPSPTVHLATASGGHSFVRAGSERGPLCSDGAVRRSGGQQRAASQHHADAGGQLLHRL
jgi:microcystin-dependent protein